jgi:hypothetical protein
VNGIEVVAYAASIVQQHARIAAAHFLHRGLHAAGVGNGPGNNAAEQPFAARQAGEPPPKRQQAGGW